MAKTKYGKYILRGTREAKPKRKNPAVMPVTLKGRKDWGGIKHRMRWALILQPTLLADKLHSHDFDEFLCFFSSDPAHELDFGAEIELSLGREGEKQIIKSPSVVCIPKGLIHGPLSVKNITKPILFCHIYLAPEYVRTVVAE
jgi:hypothetical protein